MKSAPPIACIDTVSGRAQCPRCSKSYVHVRSLISHGDRAHHVHFRRAEKIPELTELTRDVEKVNPLDTTESIDVSDNEKRKDPEVVVHENGADEDTQLQKKIKGSADVDGTDVSHVDITTTSTGGKIQSGGTEGAIVEPLVSTGMLTQ